MEIEFGVQTRHLIHFLDAFRGEMQLVQIYKPRGNVQCTLPSNFYKQEQTEIKSVGRQVRK